MRTRSLLMLLALALLPVGCGSSSPPTPKPTAIGLSSPLVVTVLGEFTQLRLDATAAEDQIAADQITFNAALKADRATPPQQGAGRTAAVSGTLAAHQRIDDDVIGAYKRLDAAWKLLRGPLSTQPGLSTAARLRLLSEQRAAALFVRREEKLLLKALRAADQRLQRFIRAH